MSQRPHILIGTPCYGGLVTQTYMESVLELMVYASTHNFDITLALLGRDALITRSRNTIVAAFLDMPQATHLLFIDADIGFKAESVDRLLKIDQELAAGMYPIKNFDWPLAQKRLAEGKDLPTSEAALNYVGLPCQPGEREEKDGFVTGTYAGTGFMLIKRSCIERMIAAYPETRYGQAHVFPRPKEQSANQYALFDCMIDPDNKTYLSEDFGFCKRWQKIGGKIWLDTRSRLTHTGTYHFEGTPGL